MLFNRVAKRIWEFVLDQLFEATCECRAVLEVQNRVPASSRLAQILSVRQHFFCRPFLSRPETILKAISRKTPPKEGTAKEGSVELDKFRAKREISCCWCEFVSSLVPCLRRNLPRGFILVLASYPTLSNLSSSKGDLRFGCTKNIL